MSGDGQVMETTVPVAAEFDSFYRKEFPAMVALAASVGAGTAIAEDVAQEAMVKAHRNWAKISSYDNPGAWVRRVTINLATSTARRRATEVKAKLRLRRRARPPMAAASPIAEPIWAAVAQLPRQQRAAIALYYLEDRPVAEIAEILECAPATAKVHLHRARTHLAEVLRLDGSIA
ncbi:MAG: sigma-70 family RNA polymerase sigma factor [Acidimicrobiia bacterium]|nr:sigma-70 family RNA polymerase sigma factor [Acidimicrobiia bacterium]MDH5237826.1 sigma-70 family RNA polymerase sigma factor [Acidimicrobiia bacterium]